MLSSASDMFFIASRAALPSLIASEYLSSANAELMLLITESAYKLQHSTSLEIYFSSLYVSFSSSSILIASTKLPALI